MGAEPSKLRPKCPGSGRLRNTDLDAGGVGTAELRLEDPLDVGPGGSVQSVEQHAHLRAGAADKGTDLITATRSYRRQFMLTNT